MEYGGLKPILPCLGGRSDAACRVVVRRMREERFNHALPVLVVVRFFVGWPARRFLPLAGACGRRGFWAWACARDSRDARVRASAQGGRSASQAKALRRRQGRAFFPPFLWRPKERGRGGGGGAQPPRFKRWLFCILYSALRKTQLNDAALLGRALAPLGTAPTENIMSNPVMVRHVMPF